MPDAADGAPTSNPPAQWSFGVQHGAAASMITDPGVAWLQVTKPSTVLGASVLEGLILVYFSPNTGQLVPNTMKRFIALGRLADFGFAEGMQGLQAFTPANTQVQTDPTPTPPPRGRWDGAKTLAFDSFTTSWTACGACSNGTPLPGDIGIWSVAPAYGNVKTIHASMGRAAADAVVLSKDIVVGGRLESGMFDFDASQGPGSKAAGPGVFIASYAQGAKINDPLTLRWLKVFPASILPLINTGNSTDVPGFGAQVTRGAAVPATSWLLATPFQGTVDFTNGTTATAPSNSFGMAVVRVDASTGAVTLAKAFTRGPGSQGKPSHGRLVELKSGDLVYVDTIWDTIDFGNAIATAKQGADMVVAVFDSAGVLRHTRVYGGSGDDEALGVVADANDVIVYGKSSQDIDFGNGVLSSGGDSQIWFARITP